MDQAEIAAVRAWAEAQGYRGTGPGNRIIVGPDGAGVAVTWRQFAQCHPEGAAAGLALRAARAPRQPRSLGAAGVKRERHTVAPDVAQGMTFRGQGRRGSPVFSMTYDPASEPSAPWLLDDGRRCRTVTAATVAVGSKWQGWAFWKPAGAEAAAQAEPAKPAKPAKAAKAPKPVKVNVRVERARKSKPVVTPAVEPAVEPVTA